MIMKNTIKEYDIIFLGLAQDCEKYLPNLFNKIDEISKKKNIQMFIGENGSNDYTFDLLQKKISKSKIYNFVDTTFIEQYEDRIKRLALARQTLKEKFIDQGIKSKFVCVIDLDDVINEIFNINLINNLIVSLEKNHDKYFGISLSSKPYYYDILNFESKEYPNNFIKQLQNKKGINSYGQRKKFIYEVQNFLSKKEMFECISGFNGLCLYNFEDYIKSSYIEDSDDQTPEHLLFNRYLHKTLKKNILVTKNYFRMPNEHKPLNNIFLFTFEKMLKYLNIYYKRLFS